MTRQYSANSEALRAIECVEGGRFDDILLKFSKSAPALGILVPAYAYGGIVLPMPAGYSQSESNLAVAITDQPVGKDSVRVGWFGNSESNRTDDKCSFHCTGHCTLHGPHDPKLTVSSKANRKARVADCTGSHCWYHSPEKSNHATNVCGHCRSHCHGHNPPFADPLADALALDPHAVGQSVESLCDLDTLARGGVGVALVHGHSSRFAFVELPEGMVAVIHSGRTQFLQRNDVVARDNFVPNVWRFEHRARQPVGGFFV